MIKHDSTQSEPITPPKPTPPIHPLIHSPQSLTYIDCLDTLHNAANLLTLFQHLNLDESSQRGGLSGEANEAFFWLAKTLEDTLLYVGNSLQAAWTQRDADEAAINKPTVEKPGPKAADITPAVGEQKLEKAGGRTHIVSVAEQLQQSVFFKAVQASAGSHQAHIYGIMAACLDIRSSDIVAFVGMLEGLKLNAAAP